MLAVLKNLLNISRFGWTALSGKPNGARRDMGDGWPAGGKVRKVYLGSCKKLSRAEALQKARRMKAEALGVRL